MGADALSDVFRAVRLTGAVFFNIDVRNPWVAEAPAGKDYIPHIMPGVQHLIEYHIISKGSCWGGLLDADPVQLESTCASPLGKTMMSPASSCTGSASSSPPQHEPLLMM